MRVGYKLLEYMPLRCHRFRKVHNASALSAAADTDNDDACMC